MVRSGLGLSVELELGSWFGAEVKGLEPRLKQSHGSSSSAGEWLGWEDPGGLKELLLLP